MEPRCEASLSNVDFNCKLRHYDKVLSNDAKRRAYDATGRPGGDSGDDDGGRVPPPFSALNLSAP